MAWRKYITLFILGGILLGAIGAAAVQITVPQAPGAGSMLVGTSTGNYIATSTDPLSVGSISGTSTATSTLNGGLNIARGCFSLAGVCISGSGSISSTFGTTSISSLFPIAWDTTLARLSFGGISTSSAPTIGHLPYWSGVNTLSSVATGTVSAGTGISVTSSRFVIGGGLTITNDGVTSISATAPLVNNVSVGAVSLTCPTCVVNTGGGVSKWATSTADSSAIYAALATKVGIGTSTPAWNLQVNGTRPFFTLSDSSASAGKKHWFLSPQGGELYFGTTTDTFATTTRAAVAITASGTLLVGHPPLTLNAIEGQTMSGAFAFDVYARQLLITDAGSMHGLNNSTAANGISIDGISSLTGQNNNAASDSLIFSTYKLSTGLAYHFKTRTGGGGTNNNALVIANQTSNVGLGTSSPWGRFSIQSASTEVPFIISSTTPASASTTLFRIDSSGWVHYGGGTPTISSCGTDPFFDGNSTDQAGTVTFGATASGCTLTFSQAAPTAPHCVVAPRAISLVNAYTVAPTTASIVITQTASGGTVWDYFCPLGH